MRSFRRRKERRKRPPGSRGFILRARGGVICIFVSTRPFRKVNTCTNTVYWGLFDAQKNAKNDCRVLELSQVLSCVHQEEGVICISVSTRLFRKVNTCTKLIQLSEAFSTHGRMPKTTAGFSSFHRFCLACTRRLRNVSLWVLVPVRFHVAGTVVTTSIFTNTPNITSMHLFLSLAKLV